MKNPCVAHRGWSGRAPENTMAAIKLAIDAPDIKWIEIDVQLSKDGVPMVIHDYNLRRTTNGRGEVKNWSASELSSLDAGSWFSPAFKGEPVPRLDDVLQASKGKCMLNVELKTDGIRYPALEEKVLERIRAFGMEDQVVLTSFHAGTLFKARKLHDGVRTGLILDAWRPTLVEELRELGADFLSIGYSRLNRLRMELLNAAGIGCMAWTINDKRNLAKLMALDPGLMLCTNYPECWREALNMRPRPLLGWLGLPFR